MNDNNNESDEELNENDEESNENDESHENGFKEKLSRFYENNKKLTWFAVGALIFIIIFLIYLSTSNSSSSKTTIITTSSGSKKNIGESCANTVECVSGGICAGNICLPTANVLVDNLRYNFKFKNKDTGKYLCLRNTDPKAYTSDTADNNCIWRTKIADNKLQIIRNKNNYSIGPTLRPWNVYSADTWPADTKWNYLDESKVLKNNYYSSDYPPGVRSDVDLVTGGCLTDESSSIKTSSAFCSASFPNNKWIPEYVEQVNCSNDSECPSGKCTNNVCLGNWGDWCNLPESCKSGTICERSICTAEVKAGDKVMIASITSAGKRYLYECGPRIPGTPHGVAWSNPATVLTMNSAKEGSHIWWITGVPGGSLITNTTAVYLQNTSSGRMLVYGGSSTGCNSLSTNPNIQAAFDVFTEPTLAVPQERWYIDASGPKVIYNIIVTLRNIVAYNGAEKYLYECNLDKTSCGNSTTKWASAGSEPPSIGGNPFLVLEKVV